MKNKNLLMFAVAMIFLIGIVNVSAEIILWDTVTLDNTTSIVNYHAYYQYDDTSAELVGANQDTAITLWHTVEPLPLDLDDEYGTMVDWCNYTIKHYKNTFDSLGNVVNTSLETQSYYFQNSSLNSSQLVFLLRNRDSLIADMRCHYTDVRGLYSENILAGRFATYMASYQCYQCNEYSFEELSNMAERNENLTANELGIYNTIQSVIDFNFQIWLIASWIIKIGMIFVAVGLIFVSVYYFYVFLMNIGKEL